MNLKLLVAAASAGALALAGCSGPEENPPVDFSSEVSVEPRAPLAFASTAACALDSDCAAGLFCFQGGCARQCADDSACADGKSCDARGRCAAARSKRSTVDGVTDVEPGCSLTELPSRIQRVARGQQRLELAVKVSPALSAGLSYRVERTDGMGDPMQVHTASGTTDFVLQVDTGLANPAEEEPTYVELQVITSAGAFAVTLAPQLPFAGHYAGKVALDQFGQTGLPIDLQIVTDPPDASLESATAAWVVLPVRADALFSPRPKQTADAVEETMARPLVFEPAPVNRWVATFTSGYDLGAGSVIAAASLAGQVRRTLRFEVEQHGDDMLIGRLSDRWTGLYDARSEYGARSPARTVFEGDLELTRVGPAPLASEITVDEVPAGDPQQLPAPALASCSDESFAVQASGAYDCEGIATLDAFRAASVELQAACAIAVVRASLAGETTASQIAAFLDGGSVGGESFADFMKRCAAGTDGTCRPTPAVLCGRQLAAFAYAGMEEELASGADLVLAFQDATREAFLGRQMGAFQTDSNTRLEWLKSSDFPAIVTSAVKNHTENLLNNWAANVLDVHLGVLAGQFDDAGLAVLSQPAPGPGGADARKTVLLEMSQSWRGAADALSLAAARWNQLHQDDATRAAKTSFVNLRMFDLYLVAGLLNDFNRASGASFASGGFASGFSQLMRELGELSLPFDHLVYARDAEVVVSTSVDPSSDNTTLLSERREAAKTELASAATAVGAIIAEAQSEALSQTELTNRMNNEIAEVRDELVELCGLPVGCSPQSYQSDPACEARVGPGQCGFRIDLQTGDYLATGAGQQSVSEAGSMLLGMNDALLSLSRSLEDLRAHHDSAQLYLEATSQFASQVEAANQLRLSTLDQMEAAIAQRQADRQSELGALLANVSARNQARRSSIAATEAEIKQWDSIRLGAIETSFSKLQTASDLNSAANFMYQTGDLAEGWGGAISEGFPTALGVSNDTTAPARAAVLMIAMGVSTAAKYAGAGMETAANNLTVRAEKEQAMTEARLEALSDQAELDDAITAADLAELEEKAEFAAQQSQAEEAALRELLLMAEKSAEAELAFQRDLIELNDRRVRYKQMLVQTTGLELQIAQAQVGVSIALQQYLKVAQRAELRAARLHELERQREEVNSLVGSPTAVFAWANRLEQAEQRLQRAKDSLYDWLVALEYLAVRPFMDQRVQILLARNTYQLEKIAAEIERLQGSCGGPISRHTAELSLRDDLLALSLELVDPVTGESQTPSERLRTLLARGHVPIDKRVRYTSDTSIGGLLSSRSVMAATFTVSLNDFANLGAACNAKVYSLAVKLVGEGLSNAQPTVSVLYDGSSELRSCQPGLDAYLNSFGRDATSFGTITRLHAPGRSVSPVAGVNAFPADSGNVSLTGLPLASQYTLLIDPRMGENTKIDWSKLEDVVLKLEYTYQDLFPAGQCQ